LRLDISISPEIYGETRRLAKSLGMTQSAFIRAQLNKALGLVESDPKMKTELRDAA